MKQAAFTDMRCALVGSVALGTVLVLVRTVPPGESIAAVVGGLAMVTVSVLGIMRRKPLFSTVAYRVTLARTVLNDGGAEASET